jgi:hypothetical protein
MIFFLSRRKENSVDVMMKINGEMLGDAWKTWKNACTEGEFETQGKERNSDTMRL